MNMPKVILHFAAAFLAVSTCHAQSTNGEIAAIDHKAGSITVAATAGFQTYRVNPSTEITINGQKATFARLAKGMSVKVSSAQPTVASRIIASGLVTEQPGADAKVQPAPANLLERRLAGTKWLIPLKDSKTPERNWFKLNADGTVVAGWHERVGNWRVISDDTAEVKISGSDPDRTETYQFNAALTQGKERRKGEIIKKVE